MPGRSLDFATSGMPAVQRNKIVSAADAVGLIRDGDTVATGGFVGIGFRLGNGSSCSVSRLLGIGELAIQLVDIAVRGSQLGIGRCLVQGCLLR